MTEKQVFLSENAAKRVRFLQARKNNPDLMLRLLVDGGGCSGFQYKFSFEEEKAADDRVFIAHGVTLLVDDTSLNFLEAAEIDYEEAMIGAAFVVKNPNAVSGCGCGNSFSI